MTPLLGPIQFRVAGGHSPGDCTPQLEMDPVDSNPCRGQNLLQVEGQVTSVPARPCLPAGSPIHLLVQATTSLASSCGLLADAVGCLIGAGISPSRLLLGTSMPPGVRGLDRRCRRIHVRGAWVGPYGPRSSSV